ncbi:MAG: DUF447 family protein [Halobacteriota archaeon]|nr:DUF447 family protein [Halobacteriota archaeon]
MDLSRSGLFEGISEVIATTRSGISDFNAAPIGIIREGKSVYAKLYPGTHTYSNISSTGMMVANVTHDPELFVRSAFSDLSTEYKDSFHGYPAIKDADAWILFRCYITKEPDPERNIKFFEVTLEPVSSKVNTKRSFRAVNRGLNAVIEATVHATRYVLTGDRMLKEWIEYYNTLVSTCGSPSEKRAMELLFRFIDEQKG